MSASPVRFSGHLWSVKTSMEPVGPGPNRFAAANVTVDVRGRLVLAISPDAWGWTCAEVVAQGGFGYGIYDWTVSSSVAEFDPAVVLGLFTWSDDAAGTHQELDIEFSRWGEAAPVGGSFTVQQAALTKRFPIAAGAGRHSVEWTPGRVAFRSRFGARVQGWEHNGRDVPVPAAGVAPRINCWLFHGAVAGRPHRVTIESFSYLPP